MVGWWKRWRCLFLVDSNTDTLSFIKEKKVFKADKGQPGMGRQKTGKSGEALVLIVPPGTQIIDDNTNEVLYDLLEDGEKFYLLKVEKVDLEMFTLRTQEIKDQHIFNQDYQVLQKILD